jgi:hypothetical protein
LSTRHIFASTLGCSAVTAARKIRERMENNYTDLSNE